MKCRCPFSEETRPKVRRVLGIALLTAVIVILILGSGCGSTNSPTGITLSDYPAGWSQDASDYPVIYSLDTVYDSWVLSGDTFDLDNFNLSSSTPHPQNFVSFGYDYVADETIWIVGQGGIVVQTLHPTDVSPHQFSCSYVDTEGVQWIVAFQAWTTEGSTSLSTFNVLTPTRVTTQ